MDYHLDKIKSALEGGVMKRPARGKNAEALFLGAPWQDLDAAKAPISAPRSLAQKNACMACHAPENVAYMIDQPLFRKPLPFAEIAAPASVPKGSRK